MKKQLDDFRKQIDKIDRLIVSLLDKRMKAVAKVGILKKENNVPPLDPARWQKVLNSKMELAKSLSLNPEMIREIYGIIHKFALKIEEKI